jgi:hypothetical protein
MNPFTVEPQKQPGSHPFESLSRPDGPSGACKDLGSVVTRRTLIISCPSEAWVAKFGELATHINQFQRLLGKAMWAAEKEDADNRSCGFGHRLGGSG